MADQAAANLFGYHQLEHIATPPRIALFSRLHILDAWNNTTCTFGKSERCYSPLTAEEGATICRTFGDFCFTAEDPLIDTDTLAFELSKLLWKSHCKAHRTEAQKNQMCRKMEYYLPFVLQWRKEVLGQSPTSSPDIEKEKHSKLSVLIPKSTNTRLTARKRESRDIKKDQIMEEATPSVSAGYHARMSTSFEQDRQEFDKVSLHSLGSRHEKRKRTWIPFTGKTSEESRMEID